ncbi:FMN-dependent dehydrogenase [Actinomyces bowdenii]|uniref:FMN-dependent dehydrogenase n=1 Tax=Actinomyces bowdenii TaxID=131109 RepID=A0A3P1VBE1_9ACTO|nr:FMN-dependent dehydrogenase [Actinomyces bowdenii]MBO3723795.1 FMN-dependent dehydrogenase [Actinomyces bowdenii]RRD29893.1 FMN-dependent dehydrogenase [Actinomyces bowdenii]
MPSYRSILTVTALHPGRDPRDVEAAARGAVAATTIVESFDVGVVAGQPRVTARFTADDDAEAREVHERVLAAVRQGATAPQAVLARVSGGRSVPVPAGP